MPSSADSGCDAARGGVVDQDVVQRGRSLGGGDGGDGGENEGKEAEEREKVADDHFFRYTVSDK